MSRVSALLATALATLVLVFGAVEAASAISLRYFGYFAARITLAGGDHLPEVAARSDLNWVQISDPDRYRPEVLDHCSPSGCIISTGNEFFRNCTGTHNPECELYPNYAERWSHLAEAVRSRIDKVGAFYLMDEPQWRGATRAELETAAATIKATYPTIPVMMVEAGPQVTSSLQVPLNVDWVGFDWYCQTFDKVEAKLATLSAVSQPYQSLFLLPEAAPLEACGGAAGHATDADIAKLQYQYYELALRNPRVIGLLAFGFWTSGYGSAQLPLTVAAHQNIWAWMVAANQPPPAPPPPAPPAPPPPSPQAKKRPARIAGEKARLKPDGRIAINLRCPAGTSQDCSGRLKLTQPAAERRRLVGARKFEIPAASSATVVVRVKQRWRPKLLRLTRDGRKVRLRAALDSGAQRTVELARQHR